MTRLALLPILLAAAACSSTEEEAPASRAGMYLHTDIFEDVPAPKNAIYVGQDGHSFSYRTKTFRTGKFVYNWAGAQMEAVGFYRETMTTPPYSWTLTGEKALPQGSTELVFLKGEDRCTVGIDHVPQLNRNNNIRIVVRVNYHG